MHHQYYHYHRYCVVVAAVIVEIAVGPSVAEEGGEVDLLHWREEEDIYYYL